MNRLKDLLSYAKWNHKEQENERLLVSGQESILLIDVYLVDTALIGISNGELLIKNR